MLPQTAVFAVSNYKPLSYMYALWAGERFRKILMGISSNYYGYNGIPSLISGRDSEGKPLGKSHVHISYLSIPDTAKLSLSHIILYSPAGFDSESQMMIMLFKKFWFEYNRDYPVTLLGLLDKVSASALLYNRPDVFSASDEWVSLTPFLLNRHLHLRKSRMKDPTLKQIEIENALEQEVRKELNLRCFPEPLSVTLLRGNGISFGGQFVYWDDFKRTRLKKNTDHDHPKGFGFRILFTEPVEGPLNLGYGCHFGLGLFQSIS